MVSEESGDCDQSQGAREGCCMISARCIPDNSRCKRWVRYPVPVETKWQCNDHWVAICCIGKLVPAAHLSEHRIRRSSRLSGSRAELRHCPGWSWSLGYAAFYFNISSITTQHSHDKAVGSKIFLFSFLNEMIISHHMLYSNIYILYCGNIKWAFCGCPFLSQTQLQLELDLVCCDSTIIQRISNINTILVNDQLFDKIVHVHIFTAYYWIFWGKGMTQYFQKRNGYLWL